MAEEKMMRLSQVARQLNVGTSTIAEHLAARGFEVENNPNTKITYAQFEMLAKEFKSSALEKKEASGLTIGKKHTDNLVIDTLPQPEKKDSGEDDFYNKNFTSKEVAPKKEPVETPKPLANDGDNDALRPKLAGIKILGKIDLDRKSPVRTETPAATPTPQPASQPVAVNNEVSNEPVKNEPVKVDTAQPLKEQIPAVELNEKPAEKPAAEVPAAQVNEKPAEKPTVEVKDKDRPVEKPEVVNEAPPVAEPEPVNKAPEQPKTNPEVAQPTVKNIEEVKRPEPAVPVKNNMSESTPTEEKAPEVVTAKADTLKGLTVLGKIELPAEKDWNKKKGNQASASAEDKKKSKRKRKRVRIGGESGETPATQARTDKPVNPNQDQNQNRRPIVKINAAGKGPVKPGAAGAGAGSKGGKPQTGRPTKQFNPREEVSDREIQDQIRATLAKLSGGKSGGSGNRSKYRGQKRSAVAAAREERMMQEQEESKVLKVTEFISASDMASLMGVSVNEVISVCMGMGMFVSINQRLDAEAITVIADEFGYEVDFASTEEENIILNEEDEPEELEPRAPIVTIMGHVDHGKTSLLDYIRRTKVTAQEAGGITQHIGAYDVMTDTGKRIAFLDTPGHEAFTAMRARGAKITDVVIIVVAADDSVMPQTKEAINHAQVAGVPIVIAINKVDKPNANPDKIREELANQNILVEEWGGKYQSQEISAKTGQGISELLEKVLLEAELLELKANPNKRAVGTVVEASLDKGRGYVATVLVQNGTLHVGDIMLAGAHYGRVKAMTDHRGNRLNHVGPSTPVQVLGLSGAPQAGDKFNVVESEREAREIANKREQILREQSIRTRKHITLDEIGRRLAIGSFKELNIIVKGDVDGSVEALSDSLLNLSTSEVQVRIIHKGVGQISESDILLASASDAIIVGFQVRPSVNARKLAEQEEIEIRLYSIIYDAINEVKDAMEGMLAPKVEEIIVGNVDVREVFKISKVGTVAGCYVVEGYIKRNSKVRIIRDGIVVHTGEIDALKRFKDDVNEVKAGYECGISIRNYNDLMVGDNIEPFEQRETKRTL